MIASIYLLLCLTTLDVDVRAGETPETSLTLTQHKGGLNLAWADTEDVLRGTMSPKVFRVGKPIVVSVHLGHIQGEAMFDGPIIFSLRPLNQMGVADTKVVTRAALEKGWKHEFVATTSGSHRLEIAWSSTRYKHITAVIEVEDPLLPDWFGYAFSGMFLLATLGYGLFTLLRGDRSTVPSKNTDTL